MNSKKRLTLKEWSAELLAVVGRAPPGNEHKVAAAIMGVAICEYDALKVAVTGQHITPDEAAILASEMATWTEADRLRPSAAN